MYIFIITNYYYISGSRPAITPQTRLCLWGPDAGMTREREIEYLLTCHSVVKPRDDNGGVTRDIPSFAEGWALTPPLSSRAKRGDPVNKKALRANARRHQ